MRSSPIFASERLNAVDHQPTLTGRQLRRWFSRVAVCLRCVCLASNRRCMISIILASWPRSAAFQIRGCMSTSGTSGLEVNLCLRKSESGFSVVSGSLARKTSITKKHCRSCISLSIESTPSKDNRGMPHTRCHC